eukprot:6474426-Pyramimonas_sp.AAC.1
MATSLKFPHVRGKPKGSERAPSTPPNFAPTQPEANPTILGSSFRFTPFHSASDSSYTVHWMHGRFAGVQVYLLLQAIIRSRCPFPSSLVRVFCGGWISTETWGAALSAPSSCSKHLDGGASGDMLAMAAVLRTQSLTGLSLG